MFVNQVTYLGIYCRELAMHYNMSCLTPVSAGCLLNWNFLSPKVALFRAIRPIPNYTHSHLLQLDLVWTFQVDRDTKSIYPT